MLSQFRVPPFTIWLKQQQFAFTLSLVLDNNCSTELCNRDLQTTTILFKRNVSSHKLDWIVFELSLLALSCLLYRRVSSLMNALEGECLCLGEISIHVNKLFMVIFVVYLRYPLRYSVVACLLVYHLFYIDVVVACLLLYPFFILMLLLYFCLFVLYIL